MVGSDGEKVGDLKTVGDADFVVGRTLRRDLHVPVKHVREVTADNKIVLDVSADERRRRDGAALRPTRRVAPRVSQIVPGWRTEALNSVTRIRKRPNRRRATSE